MRLLVTGSAVSDLERLGSRAERRAAILLASEVLQDPERRSDRFYGGAVRRRRQAGVQVLFRRRTDAVVILGLSPVTRTQP